MFTSMAFLSELLYMYVIVGLWLLFPDIELPNKRGFENFVSKLPFTAKDPDPTIILERKQGLEGYLQVYIYTGTLPPPLSSSPVHVYVAKMNVLTKALCVKLEPTNL